MSEYRTTDEAIAYWHSLSDDEQEFIVDQMKAGDPTWKRDLDATEQEHVLAQWAFANSPQEKARYKREREEKIASDQARIEAAWARGMLIVNGKEWTKEEAGEAFSKMYQETYGLSA